jgi:hypothetical protein
MKTDVRLRYHPAELFSEWEFSEKFCREYQNKNFIFNAFLSPENGALVR